MVALIRIVVFSLLFISSSLSAVIWTYTENQTDTDLLALGYPVPIPIDSLTAVDGFRSYQSLHARHQDLMIVSDYVMGQIVGQTSNDRDIWAYQLSDADNTTVELLIPESAVLQNGGIHAREWSTPEVTTGIMELLVENENDQSLYQYLLENLNIIIQPVENVDGFLQTQRFANTTLQSTYFADPSSWPRDGRMRRKNMRAVDEMLSTIEDGMLGIDLNRNNDPYWNTSSGSSSNNGSLVYHGNAPSSEPETLSLLAAAALGPVERLRFYVDTHSFSQLWYLPDTDNVRRNTIAREVAQVMRSTTGNRYDITPSSSGSGIGSTDEYFAYTFEIPSYTLETEPQNNGSVQYGGNGVSHSGFILPEAEIARVRVELAEASIMAWYMQSGPAAVIAIEIRDVATDTVVFAGDWQAISPSERQFNETVNFGLTANAQYRIWVAYNKPMRWLGETNTVEQYREQTITLSPQIIIEGFSETNTAFSQEITGNNSDWLTTPGGAGIGYLSYKSDAFMTEFTLDATIKPSTSTLLTVAINNADLLGTFNDADPKTVVDWNAGWANFENSAGLIQDEGGVDRTLRIINDGSKGFTKPKTATQANIPDPNARGSSGGSFGGSDILWLLLLLVFIYRLRFAIIDQ